MKGQVTEPTQREYKMVESMGSVRPPRMDKPLFADLPNATKADSFQTRMELILKKYGVGILDDSAKINSLLQDAQIDRKTHNVFRVVLMTGILKDFLLYAEKKSTRDELEKACSSVLGDEWGLSVDAFQPIIDQMISAVDNATAERVETVGKTICNQLKEMRRRFAEANHIDYYEEDCTETEPCDGTCPYCDSRTQYLISEAKKIAAVRDVIYPQFDIKQLDRRSGSEKLRRTVVEDEMLVCGRT